MRLTQAEKDARKAERDTKAKIDLDAYVERTVAAAPPLTREQIDKLSRLLRQFVDCKGD